MKPIITTILLLLLEWLTAQPLPDTLSLNQLRNLAETNSLNVLSAQTQRTLAEFDLEIFRAQTKPRLDLAANLPNYFKSFNETVQPDGTVAFRPVTINNSFAQLNLTQPLTATGGTLFMRSNLQRFDDFENDVSNYNGIPIRIGLFQPIFAYNSWKWRRKILPARAAELTAMEKAEVAAASARATELFFQLLIAEQDRIIARTNQAAGERLLKIASERYELGKINQGDLVQIELDLAAATQNLIRANRSVATVSNFIYQLLGFDYPSGGEIIPRVPESSATVVINPDEALSYALKNRPEVLTATRARIEAQSDLQRTKRELGPQLSFTASIGLVRSDPQLREIYSDPQSEQIVGLELSLPILDWGERKKSIRQSETQLAFTEVQNERQVLNLEANVRLAVNQWNGLAEELALAERIRDLAEERFRISSESYLLGSIPLTELTLAQQNRDQLSRAYLATLRTYWQTYADIQQLTLHNFL